MTDFSACHPCPWPLLSPLPPSSCPCQKLPKQTNHALATEHTQTMVDQQALPQMSESGPQLTQDEVGNRQVA